MLTPSLIALQFLTRIPVPAGLEVRAGDMGKSALVYPLIGLLIGMVLWLASMIIPAQQTNLTAVIILFVWVFITGALHLDGLADSADAWLGGHGDRERTLEIMQDTSNGSAAVVMLVLVLLAKYIALSVLLSSSVHWQGLLLAPLMGRTSALFLCMSTPYARQAGLASKLKEELNSQWAAGVVIGMAVLTLFIPGIAWLQMMLSIAVVVILLRWLMMKRIGGFTGDTAGAMVEIVELVTLISLIM